MNKVFVEWLQSLVEAIVIILILFFFCWPLKIDGNSMEATFSSNDRVIISRACGFFNLLQRSDVIVCKIKEDNEEVVILKRLIGIPGDKIEIVAGKVFVNSRLVEENYVSFNDTYNLFEIELGQDEYFVLGDNRVLSSDSRHFGPLKKSSIIGKVLIKWYPFNEIKTF